MPHSRFSDAPDRGAASALQERGKSRTEGEIQIKKKARQVATRLPTERLATACWDVSIFKRTAWKPASLLDFCSLQRSDREMFCTAYPQSLILSVMDQDKHHSSGLASVKPASPSGILDPWAANQRTCRIEVTGH
jgi:hypothetical protein